MKARYFFGAAAVTAVAASWLIVVNQQVVNEQLQQIETFDTQGKATTAQQQQLKGYVASHTGLHAQLFLQTSFTKAQTAAKAASSPSSNGQLYSQAQAACSGKSDSVVQARCVEQYVAARGAKNPNPQPVVAPNQADYTLSTQSPSIAPDLPGVLMVVTAALAVFGLVIYTIKPRH